VLLQTNHCEDSMALKLWNFKTGQFDTVASVTDTNVVNYYPENHVLDNHYAILRDQGEQPIQALTALFATHHALWN
jgi:cyclopropane fatty-acyl-phospholipid synthase-like methyltransferase